MLCSYVCMCVSLYKLKINQGLIFFLLWTVYRTFAHARLYYTNAFRENGKSHLFLKILYCSRNTAFTAFSWYFWHNCKYQMCQAFCVWKMGNLIHQSSLDWYILHKKTRLFESNQVKYFNFICICTCVYHFCEL